MTYSQKKKVLFFVSPYFGGASRMTITIANLLDRNKYNVKFVIYGKEIKEIVNYIPKGYDYVHLKYRNIWDFVTLKMIRLFKQEKPYCVFCSFRHINVRVIWASKILGGIKTVLRNENSLEHFRFDKKLLLKWSYPFADVIITQQEEMRDELVRLLPSIANNVVVCHNYLDTNVIDNNIVFPSPYPQKDEIRFVCAARITKEKGYDVLLKAFSIVHKKIPKTGLYLLGRYQINDKYYNQLCKYIEEENLKDCVHFEGLVANPHIYEKYAQCFVLPSYIEGLPNALVEAMYIGVPVVATTCIPIISRMVDVGRNGYLVPPGNFKEMASAMIKALSLTNCKTIYQPAPKEAFTRLFA